jgi:Galactose oxidase, central domain
MATPTKSPTPTPTGANEWTWMSGSDSANVPGVYGEIGVPSVGNAPGSRYGAAGWTDLNGNLWIFGGEGLGAQVGNGGDLNDLWEYNPTSGTWTWQSGSNTTDAQTLHVPPPRSYASAWTDSSGKLWLFGGCQGRGLV